MPNPQRVIDDATHMSMLFILDRVTMTADEKAITERILREHLAEQDLHRYSTNQLLRYLRDIIHDFTENQDDLAEGNWEE